MQLRIRAAGDQRDGAASAGHPVLPHYTSAVYIGIQWNITFTVIIVTTQMH